MDSDATDSNPHQSVAEQSTEQATINHHVIDLLNAWDREDPEEQRETLEFLLRALDEDRT